MDAKTISVGTIKLILAVILFIVGAVFWFGDYLIWFHEAGHVLGAFLTGGGGYIDSANPGVNGQAITFGGNHSIIYFGAQWGEALMFAGLFLVFTKVPKIRKLWPIGLFWFGALNAAFLFSPFISHISRAPAGVSVVWYLTIGPLVASLWLYWVYRAIVYLKSIEPLTNSKSLFRI